MARIEKDFSSFVAKTLNMMGYSWKIIQERRKAVRKNVKTVNSILNDSTFTAFATGSKREGVTTPLAGDQDCMYIMNEIIATEDLRFYENQPGLISLEIDRNLCFPGYTFLLNRDFSRSADLAGNGLTEQQMQEEERNSCCVYSDSGESYFSSEIFLNTVAKMFTITLNELSVEHPDSLVANVFSVQPTTGPSVPIHSGHGVFQTDNVVAIHCHCPSVFESFWSRPRHQGWPPQDILKELSRLEAHAVPIGFKRSTTRSLEWRICFTKAEIRLIESLTEAQIHVFVLLKIFAKDVLKDVWDAMTSYVMKNITLWMAELTPGHMFTAATIVDRFLACLFFLKICVKLGRLPSYMISERNLLSHDQFVVKKRKLLSVLDECLQEKGSCLLRSGRLKDALMKMYKCPERSIKYGFERDKTECAGILFTSRFGPEILKGSTTLQDMSRFLLSGNGREIMLMLLERIRIDELFHDPYNEILRVARVSSEYIS